MMRILLISAVLIVIGVCLVYWGSKAEYTHYKGDTEISTEQYAQVVAENKIVARSKWNYIDLAEGDRGLVQFVYDFYLYDEDVNYTFLTQPARGILDYPVFYLAGRGLKEVFIEMWYVVLIMLTIFGVPFYIALKKPRLPIMLLKRIQHFGEGKYYSKIKDTKGNVATDVNMINLNSSSGIICVRCWEVSSDGCLQSVGRGTKWDKKELYADTIPDRKDLNGVHAYRLGTHPHIKTKVMGIVELNGKYEYHVDGVVRAEHCKIFGLFMSKGYSRIGNYLSSKYELPIYFADNPEQGYLEWLYSESGIEAINRNYEILKGD